MTETLKKKLKETVFLPKTNFEMKGNLVNKELTILENWAKIDLFKELRKKSTGRKKFILHFGPPYANGRIHIGHALISILKDAVTKFYQMLGYDAPLVIGWDCHGLPIEWKIEEEYLKQGRKRDTVPVIEFLTKCREFADKWMNIQKAEFIRLGVIFDTENPYCTMHKETEAVILEKFFEIYKKGLIYRGKKPVMWSVVERTALAEAELEYYDKISDAIYVKFPIIKTDHKELNGAYAIIWTTTPWTIPGNKAIAYSRNFVYSLIKVKDENYLVARDLITSFVNEANITEYEVVCNINGENLKGTICTHPLRNIGYMLEIPLLHADHVTIDSGVGLVHTAPAHGVEDFMLGKAHNLEIEDIVNGDGTLIDTLPCFGGEHVFKVNHHIIDELKNAGHLVHAYQIVHSYPHSWRSKAPLIFRTTDQWFLSVGKIRDKLLSEIEKVEWFPSGHINRIRSMVEKRPDWCISRQRKWGVPIALFINKETGEVLLDDVVFEKVIESVRTEGLETWHKHETEYFLGSKYDISKYEKVMDTLEVWFDSACSHHYTLQNRKDLSWPAGMYFEGSDQHRGWFQSSLVESVAVTGKAPYKQVATNGFVLDKNGRKMSKSTGNVISPDDITGKYGADILRLWCLNSDYSDDLRIGEEIIKHQMDVYRRFRNTLRYLLGVISIGKSDDEEVPYEQMPEIEKSILHKLYELNEFMHDCVKKYEFQRFFTQLHTFCANDLSSFYFDIRKDCIYCDGENDIKRRACLSVMDTIFKHLVHWLAPVLSFTSEEAWQSYKNNNEASCSIHLNDFPKTSESWKNNEIDQKWNLIRNIRKGITGAIEIERLAKTIGSSLEAEVMLYCSRPEIAKNLMSINMAEVAIVSKVTIVIAQIPPNANMEGDNSNTGVGVIIKKSAGQKCDRCWKILEDSSIKNHDEYGEIVLCSRCANVVDQQYSPKT